ncbi:GDSL lipase-like [Bidens hawaiensis]|uniref:GDSL lipase-like n=1 Tax=Bidens hawaiensis TaxID=980011 RepID=UPI0040490F3F
MLEQMAIANVQLIIVSCFLMITCCLSSEGQFSKHSALFVFGDSLLDSGNNNYINTTAEFQANFWPYGISYFNPPTGRFSNGRLIHDFIAEQARLPFIPTYLKPGNNEFVYGANFASAGAGALVESHAGFVVDLKTQLRYFGDLEKHFRRKLGDAKTDQILSNAVYIISCGVNDYPVGNKDSILYHYTHEQYVGMVIGNMTDVFKGIHKKGGRKFGVFNIPPMACNLPSIRAGPPGNTCNQHNQQLSKRLEELEKQLDGFMYAKFDLNAELNKRIKNPSRYGFKKGACCGSGPLRRINSCGGKRGVPKFEVCDNVNDYLFFDSVHPSEVANRQFAELFWNGDSNVTTPYNLKTLFHLKKK